MNTKELLKDIENLSNKEKFEIFKQGSESEKLAIIPYFEMYDLVDVLKDANPKIRSSALKQIDKLDELYDIARFHNDIVILAYDTSPEIRKAVLDIVLHNNGRLSLAKDNGNTVCDTAYWEFIRTADMLSKDPNPEIAEKAQKEMECHYNRYPQYRPKEQDRDIGKEKFR